MAPGLDWWLCYGIHLKLLSSVLAPTSGTVRAMGMDPMRDRVRYVSRIGVVFGWRTDLWWDQPESASFEWKRGVGHPARSLRADARFGARGCWVSTSFSTVWRGS
jgi:hypothetical protein